MIRLKFKMHVIPKLRFLRLVIGLVILIGCGGSDSSTDPDPVPEPMGPDSDIIVETLTIGGNFTGDDGISIDSEGSLYVSHLANSAGNTIYKVENESTSTVFSSNLTAPMGHAFNSDNSLFAAFNGPTMIAEILPDGTFTTFIEDARFQGGSIVIDEEGNLYHTVFKTNKIYKITPEKVITEIASGEPLNVTFGIALDDENNIYAANFSDGRINLITSSGDVSTIADLPTRIGYIVYANDVLYATGFTDHRIYQIELDGSFKVLIGTGVSSSNDGVGSTVSFSSPNGIAASSDGKTLYVTQKNFKIRKLTLEK